MSRVAVVTPWYGAALHGGAERQAREVARRLAARGHRVEVLTTCCRSFADDWDENHHPSGATEEDGLVVRRFPADARDAAAFDRANARLLSAAEGDMKAGVSPVDEASALDFAAHNINSAALVAHLRSSGAEFDAFLFIPYLYGTTLAGLDAAGDRALLQPCLHDESYARLPAVGRLFRRARLVLFNSEGERELALRLYGPGLHPRARLVGEGVEFEPPGEAAARAALPADLRGARFVLYLGRRDENKNTHLLVRAFRAFKHAAPTSDLRLVLAGPGADSFDARAEGVSDLGAVAEPTKSALLVAARALFQPSRRESYSRVMMESWRAGRPVAAHRDCPATALAVEHSGGGWLAATEDEWAGLFARVDAAGGDELNTLGTRGRAYAAEHADWDRVIDRYEEVLRELCGDGKTAGPKTIPTPEVIPSPAPPLRAVHQLLPDFAYGDAISNQALAIRDHLRAGGYESEIFAMRREEAAAGEAWLVGESVIGPGAGLVYHHSIGSEVTGVATAHPGPRCLVYHNVTPHEFYAPHRPGFAWLLETGRAGLARLARHFPCSVGDSRFNADELRRAGFASPGVLPIIVDPAKWNVEPDERLMRDLQDGRTNLLFVGRVAPNKRQDALVRVFAEYARLDPGARLVLAGDAPAFDPYARGVLALAERLGVARQVAVTGRIDDRALLAYYRTAHLYLSPSEHEGFGVPLVEAMWFDVPVLARAGSAVTETLGAAGVLYDAAEAPAAVARLAHRLARADAELRRRVVAAQRVRREEFTPGAVRPALSELLRRMEAGHAARAEVAPTF